MDMECLHINVYDMQIYEKLYALYIPKSEYKIHAKLETGF